MKPLLFVDGYNIIGAWREVAKNGLSLAEARDKLIHLLADYSGYTAQEIWVVFDAHLGERPSRSIEQHSGLNIVFTKHGETADHFIERKCHEMPKYRVARVATSDATEQTIILGRGATRMSARELLRELTTERSSGYNKQKNVKTAHSSLGNVLSDEQYAILEKLRRSK